MPRRPFHLQEAVDMSVFAGLDYRISPDQNKALTMSNIDLDEAPAIRTRDGTIKLAATTAAKGAYAAPILATDYILVSRGTNVIAVTSSGTTAFTDATGTTGPHSFARLSGPTLQRVYIANVGGTDVRYFDATGFHAQAYTGTTPTGSLLAITPWDNRLVNANIAADPSRVLFSDPGDPTTFGVNNYVDLAPGDEAITGMVAWGNQLFVFKSSKFFVFYGVGTSATGTPVFNYRTVNTGVGAFNGYAAGLFPNPCVTAAPDGVYFVDNQKGMYRTTGAGPVKVSSPFDPSFRNSPTNVFGSGDSFYVTGVNGIGAWRERVFLGASNGATLVYDTTTGQWMRWAFPRQVVAFTGMTGSTTTLPPASMYVVYDTGVARVDYNHATTDWDANTDTNVAFTGTYRSPFMDFSMHQQKTMREQTVWGSGTVDLGMSVDYGSIGTTSSLALGTWPAFGTKRRRHASRGTSFSWRASGPAPWLINKVVGSLAVSEIRDPSETGTVAAP